MRTLLTALAIFISFYCSAQENYSRYDDIGALNLKEMKPYQVRKGQMVMIPMAYFQGEDHRVFLSNSSHECSMGTTLFVSDSTIYAVSEIYDKDCPGASSTKIGFRSNVVTIHYPTVILTNKGVTSVLLPE